MIQLIRHTRHMIIAAAAALLGGAALLSVSAPPASAAFHECPPGEFCLYFNEDANGGFYHLEGSDPNLNNNLYEGGDDGQTVGNTAQYADNNGIRGPKDDVMIYTGKNWTGAQYCIARTDRGVLPVWDDGEILGVESFEWVSGRDCNAAFVLDLRERASRGAADN